MVTGERREESPRRAKYEELVEVPALCAGVRQVLNWRPILDYPLDKVWSTITASGLPRHVAYDLGNERLSCAFCVLASKNDLCNGARHCPEMLARYLKIEEDTGHTFRHNMKLATLVSGVLDEGLVDVPETDSGPWLV